MLNYPDIRFLVVDDKLSMRKIVSQLLRSLGAQNIQEASNGKLAIEVLEEANAKKSPIQFVISDWNMPEMEGIDLLKFCRAHPYYKDVPFILITAEGSPAQVEIAIRAGADNYLTKPFTAEMLEPKLKAAYERRMVGK